MLPAQTARPELNPTEPSLSSVAERFRLAVEVAPYGFLVVDGKGIIALANAEVENLFGYGPEELTHRPVETLIPERFRDRVRADRAVFFQGATTRLPRADCNLSGLRKDGSEVPVEIRLRLYDAESTPLLLITVVDVTESKRAEEARKDLLKEYRMMFDSVPALIWYKDRNNRILRVNRPAAESMGKEVAELEGKSTYELYPDEAAAYHASDLEVINSGRPKLGIIEQVVTKSGDKLWAQTDKVPYRNEQGEIIGVIVFAMDVTERQRAQEEVRQLNTELEQRVRERTAELEAANVRMQTEIAERKRAEIELAQRARQLDDTNKKLVEAERLKSAFFANVSHELRTPLTLILAPLESLLAAEHGALTQEQTHLLETVHNNSVRLLQMVTSLLDFSKFEAQRFEVKYDLVEIVALTKAIGTDFGPMMCQLGLEYQFQTDHDEAWINTDRHLYERILFNLLSNASKFTPRGGRIAVHLTIADDRLKLSVQDSGIGIAPGDLPHLFQKFRQLEGTAVRRFEGTGLGLALVKEFSGLLGGTVSASSTLNEGSTFTVIIPCGAIGNRPEATETTRTQKYHLKKYASGTQAQTWTEGPESSSLERVLIAEDNVELATYIASLLRDLCQTRIAQDGEEALEIAAGWSPHVVLSDVMMPRRDGLSLCRELKSNPKTAAIPVVLLTAQTHRDALLKGWEAGADEYLFKPFHPRELLTRVKAILGAVRQRRSAEEELRNSAAELARSNAELEQFAYVASHDLQEPLRKIQAFGDMLTNSFGPTLTEEGRDYLRRMQNAAQRMRALIDDLLMFSRVTREARPFTDVDLTRTAQEVLSDLDARLRDTGGRVEIDPLPHLQADAMQMRQLMQNLIGNGLKFRRGNESPLVTVRGRILHPGESTLLKEKFTDPMCEVRVQDNGIGFDVKYLDRIFAPFQRLHGRGQYEGTGMGLAICRKIVERHGGVITAQSVPEQGATFVVYLPLQQERRATV